MSINIKMLVREKIATPWLERKKAFNVSYRVKYSEKLSAHHRCEVCQGKYVYMNKAHHFNTKKHKNALVPVVMDV